MASHTTYTHYSSDEVSVAYAPPYYGPADHSQQEAPADPQAWLLGYHLEQLVGGTSVTPDWTDNDGQPSQNAPLLTANRFVPQCPPCVAGGPVSDQPGTQHVPYDLSGQIFSGYGGQQERQHCAPPIGNIDQVYGDRILQNSAAVSSARSEYLSVRQDIPYTGAAHHTGSTSSPVGYCVDEYTFGRQPEGDYHPMDHCDPCQPLNGAPLSGSGSGSEYQQFVREEFPPSGHTDRTFAENSTEYFGTKFSTASSPCRHASEHGVEELGPISCHVAPSGQTGQTFSSYSGLIEYLGDQDTRGFYLPSGNVPYSDNGTLPYQGTSYDSGGRNYTDGGQNMCTETYPDACYRPTIETEQTDYNQGAAWTTTATPPAANVTSLETAGSLGMQPDPVPSFPSPHPEPSNSVDGDAEHTETAQHSHQCRLDSGCGKTCGADVSINRKRHFKSHLRRELRRIKNGSMDLSRAKIIKSEADLRRAEELEVPCPYGCKIYGVPMTYARKANLRRHLEQTCWKPLSDKEIDDVATKAFSRKGKTSRRT
ncbi:hypothetical protein JB92DRAFT_3005876 [Gautieria morchelliformis]|nr:hypothetical protein JB92DRAFT_3005876 [Gautieria morchelliformis]